MNLLLSVMALQMYSSFEVATSAHLRGGTTKKPRCSSEEQVESAADKVAKSHLILADATGVPPPCFSQRKCGQFVCPKSISSSAEFFATASPFLESAGGSNRQAYLNISANARLTVCEGPTTVPVLTTAQYAEVRFPGDFEYAIRMCRARFVGCQTATLKMPGGVPVPVLDPASGKFYFSAAHIDDTTGSYSAVYASNKAADVSQSLTKDDLVKSILSGAEDTGFATCADQMSQIIGAGK